MPAPQANHQPRPVLAKLFGQRHSGIEASNNRRLGRSSVTRVDAPSTRRAAGLGQANLRARRTGRRLAVGQIDNAHAIALPGQLGQGAPASNLHVVGMGADGHHIQLL